MKIQMKSLSVIFVLGLALAPVTLQAAPPAILQEMPGDCQVVVATQPLAALSTKVDSFARQAQLPVNPNGSVNLAEMIGAELDMPGQVDASRGAGLCIKDVDQVEKTLVAFLPVLNADTAIAQMGAQKAEGAEGLWTPTNEDIFLKPVGKYLLFAENADMLTTLARRPKGVQLTPAQKELFSKSDAVALIQLNGLLQKAKPEILREITQEEEIQKHPALNKILTMAVDRLMEVDNAAAGIRLTDEGISFNLQGQAQAGSALAKYLSNQPMTDISPLAKMPRSNFIAASAMRMDYASLLNPLKVVIDAFAADPSFGEKLDPAELTQLKSLISQMGTAMGSAPAAQVLYVPAAADPGSGLKVVELYYHNADMTAVVDIWAKICPLVTQMTERAGFKVLVDYKKSAGTVEGLSYDEFSLDISQLPIPPEMLQAIAMQWGGQPKITEQICCINPNLMAVGFGPGSIQEAVKLAKASPGGLNQDPAIIKTAKNLPQKANVLGFLNVGPYMQWAMSSMMGSMGDPGQAGMDPMLMMMGPVFGNIKGTAGVAVTVKDGYLEMEMFAPTEAVQSSVGAVMGMMMMGATPPPGAAPPPGQQQSQPPMF